MRILVVEDEPKVAAFLKQGLEESGHDVLTASDGLSGISIAQHEKVDLVLLDVMLPQVDGIEACKRIRKAGGTMPIIMVTALGAIDMKVVGLDAGADDYLVKPFEFQELLARIRSFERRGAAAQPLEEVLHYADLTLDLSKKEALREGRRISLTAKELALLEFFMRDPEKVHSRSTLSVRVWDIDFNTGTNVVEAYIKLLRKKVDREFGTKLIHTRFGQGYILTDNP
ncbi:MAG: response regulator transcription factor [Flavobacteriales bacterium]|jgi:two-component system copper resistance phosphate regulon response regulator CusR|nr:response regulator transcription factor [Flavobacteriales bacterium]